MLSLQRTSNTREQCQSNVKLIRLLRDKVSDKFSANGQ